MIINKNSKMYPVLEKWNRKLTESLMEVFTIERLHKVINMSKRDVFNIPIDVNVIKSTMYRITPISVVSNNKTIKFHTDYRLNGISGSYNRVYISVGVGLVDAHNSGILKTKDKEGIPYMKSVVEIELYNDDFKPSLLYMERRLHLDTMELLREDFNLFTDNIDIIDDIIVEFINDIADCDFTIYTDLLDNYKESDGE